MCLVLTRQSSVAGRGACSRADQASAVARDLGISGSCLRGWMANADIEDGRRHGPTKDGRAELVELRRKLRVAQMENEILRRRRACSGGGKGPKRLAVESPTGVPAKPLWGALGLRRRSPLQVDTMSRRAVQGTVT